MLYFLIIQLPNTLPPHASLCSLPIYSLFLFFYSDSLLSATIFVPLDQAVQAAGPATATADSAMYNMLRGAWCPEELANLEVMNSMLGEYTNREAPLRFTNESGSLVIKGELGVAKVLNHSVGCNSVIFVTDVPLYLPRAALTAPPSLPTLPIRHLTCNPPNITTSPSSENTSGGGNSTLAIGLGVGLGVAALLAAIAMFTCIRRRKQRHALRPSSPKTSCDNASSPDQNISVSSKGAIEDGGGSSDTATLYSTSSTAPASTIFGSLVSFPTAGLAESGMPAEPSAFAGSGTVDSEGSKAEAYAQKVSSGAGRGTSLTSRAASTSLDLWEIDPSEVQIAVDAKNKPVELGRGSFGAVYRGTLRGVQPAAIKVLNASIGTEAEAAFHREAAILKHVNRDRNVVQLYGTSKMPDGKLLLVTELMEGGDLRRALNDPETKEVLAWHRAGKRVALDIARGLTALHAVRVIHRDLKSRNVLLTETLTAKVADVGIAAVHSQGYLSASDGYVLGTLAWSAPELLLGKRCTEKVDIYSLGIVLWEIATGKVPQRGFTQPPPPSERCPAELAALIKECTNSDVRERPTAKEVCEIIMAPLAQP